MGLWWVGAIALLVVVLPVVIFLLNRILAAVERIRDAADDILVEGVALNDGLEPVPELLAKTDSVIAEVQVGAVRYAGSAQLLLLGSDPQTPEQKLLESDPQTPEQKLLGSDPQTPEKEG